MDAPLTSNSLVAESLRSALTFRLRSPVDRGWNSYDMADRLVARSWAIIPELAIEIISRTNTANDVAEKLEEYFKVGVRHEWVVYPCQSKVYVHAPTTKVAVLAPGNELDGGDVLPDCRMSISELIEQAG